MACLVSNDESNRAPTGCFQNERGLFSLLLSIQQSLEGAHARLDLADVALLERERCERKATSLQAVGGAQ